MRGAPGEHSGREPERGGRASGREPEPGRNQCARRTAEQRQPKYLRIYAELRDRITSGQWPAGSPLPPQRDLAGEFGVSIMTLRQALQLLTDDGLVAARHGSGTYVAARYDYDLGHLRSFAADLAAQGAEISTRLLATRSSPRPRRSAPGSAAPAEVLQLRRLRLAAGGRSSCRPPTCRCRWRAASTRPGLARRGPVHGAGRARAGGHPRGGDHQPVCPGTGSRPVTWPGRPAARRCSATGSASPRPAWPSWTTTRCCPATASRSPPTGPPTGWTCTTR